MPRKQKPPRLYLRSRAGREKIWVIRDGDNERSTGCGIDRRKEAEEALAAFIIEKHASPSGLHTPDSMSIGTALTIYAREHASTVKCPERIGYSIEALAPFWGDLPIAAIKTPACRRYVKERGVKSSTSRRELGTLVAALNYCVREGRLTHAPSVWLPEKIKPRERWLTPEEAEAIILAARSVGNEHLARFILVSLYTGTRKSRVLALQWMPNFTGGHVDLEAGLMYRRSAKDRPSKKRQPEIKIPARLLVHLRNWRNDSRQYLIEWNGQSIKDIKRSWATAVRDAGLSHVPPHVLRHTALTWAMQEGASIPDAAGFFGMSTETLEKVYYHHHPDHQKSVHDAINNSRFRG